jgi:hypothetical protein
VRIARALIVVAAAAVMAACSSKPSVDALRDSFAQQLQANKFVSDFQRNGDDFRFSGPGANGEDKAIWRVHIDMAAVEDNSDAGKPFRGVVKSSWYSNDQLVTPRGRDSNLPVPLTSGGLAQDCWALWNPATSKWEWE